MLRIMGKLVYLYALLVSSSTLASDLASLPFTGVDGPHTTAKIAYLTHSRERNSGSVLFTYSHVAKCSVLRMRGGSNNSVPLIVGVGDELAEVGAVLPCQARRCRFTAADIREDVGIEGVVKTIAAMGASTRCSLCGAAPMHRHRVLPFCACGSCGSSALSHGLATEDDEARWLAFFCSRCVEKTSHALPGMYALKTRWCLICKRVAMYGPSGGAPKQATHCNRHRQSNDQDIVHPHCQYVDGCPKRPTYGNLKAGGKPQFCAAHKLPGQVDVRHPKCQQEDCSRQALCGVQGTRTPIFCVSHAEASHVNLVSPQCRKEGCRLRPTFGARGGKGGAKALYCAAHCREGDVNIMQRMCDARGCKRSGSFVASDKHKWHCAQHKQLGAANARSKKCKFGPGCGLVASFGDPHEGFALFCGKHKHKFHVDVRHKKSGRDVIREVAEGVKGGEKDGEGTGCRGQQGAPALA